MAGREHREARLGRWLLTILGVGLGGLLPTARADLTLTFESVVGPDQAVPSQQILIKGDRLGVANPGVGVSMVYFADYDRVYAVDHQAGTFLSLHPEKMKVLAAQAAETRRQMLEDMEARMAELPKAEREQLRIAMDQLHAATDHITGAKLPARELKRRAEPVEINGLETTVVDASLEGNPQATYFLASRESLGVPEVEWETLRRFVAFLQDLAGKLPPAARTQIGDLDMLATSEGRIPVKVERPSGVAERLAGVDVGEIEAEQLHIPTRYRDLDAAPPAGQ